MVDDFVDLTQKNIGKNVRFTDVDENIINNNPGNLTKEGCMHKVWLWAQSGNSHVLKRYLAMYALCKNFAKSGKTTDGKTILSRKKHTSNLGITKEWIIAENIGGKDEEGNYIIYKSVADLEKFVKSKIGILSTVTRKG